MFSQAVKRTSLKELSMGAINDVFAASGVGKKNRTQACQVLAPEENSIVARREPAELLIVSEKKS